MGAQPPGHGPGGSMSMDGSGGSFMTLTNNAPADGLPETTEGRPVLSIVICTFQRPDLLEPCLESCLAQTELEPGSMEVVVVDNCPDGSAKPLVDRLMPPDGEPALHYVNEQRTNLSHARNTGAATARGELLAYVDDDNVLPPRWSRIAIDLMAEKRADILFGDVDPIFPETVDPDVIETVRFYFHRRVAGGSDGRVRPKPDGNIHDCRTCNVVLRKDLCFPPDEPVWFDPVFGHAGGEDLDYFMRLCTRVRGLRIFTSPKALMYEYIPANRISPSFVVDRAYRGAQAYAVAKVRNSANKPVSRAVIAAKALLQVAFWEFTRFRLSLRGKELSVPNATHHARAVGKLNGPNMMSKTGPYR